MDTSPRTLERFSKLPWYKQIGFLIFGYTLLVVCGVCELLRKKED